MGIIPLFLGTIGSEKQVEKFRSLVSSHRRQELCEQHPGSPQQNSFLAGTERSTSFQQSTWCWISAPGPRWGSWPQNASMRERSQHTKSAAQELAPQHLLGDVSRTMLLQRPHGAGLPGCHTQRGVASVWQGWSGRKGASKKCVKFGVDSSLSLVPEQRGGYQASVSSASVLGTSVYQTMCLPDKDHLG